MERAISSRFKFAMQPSARCNRAFHSCDCTLDQTKFFHCAVGISFKPCDIIGITERAAFAAHLESSSKLQPCRSQGCALLFWSLLDEFVSHFTITRLALKSEKFPSYVARIVASSLKIIGDFVHTIRPIVCLKPIIDQADTGA